MGRQNQALVADFGSAIVTNIKTISPATAGTSVWMAPETRDRVQELTPRVDVFSFAGICYMVGSRQRLTISVFVLSDLY
jgi:serine/threonine protein kinase